MCVQFQILLLLLFLDMARVTRRASPATRDLLDGLAEQDLDNTGGASCDLADDLQALDDCIFSTRHFRNMGATFSSTLSFVNLTRQDLAVDILALEDCVCSTRHFRN